MQLLTHVRPNDFDSTTGTSVCIGMFDGIHKGHQLLILKTVHSAKENRQPSVLLTFQNNPKISGKESVALTSMTEKQAMIEALGIDYLVNLPFPGHIAEMVPATFVDSILVSCLHASNVYIGRNFRFGYMRTGNSDDLKYIGSERSMHVMVEHMMTWEGKEISSTYCRFLLSTRNMEKATAMLGYPYFISGQVIHGQGRGGKIGLPTLNLAENFLGKIKPGEGVYATKTLIQGKLYDSVTLYGPVPSFNQCENSIETVVLNFDGDVYGEKATVFFYSYLRDIVRFSSSEDLIHQIEKDKAKAIEVLSGVGKFPILLDFLK